MDSQKFEKKEDFLAHLLATRGAEYQHVVAVLAQLKSVRHMVAKALGEAEHPRRSKLIDRMDSTVANIGVLFMGFIGVNDWNNSQVLLADAQELLRVIDIEVRAKHAADVPAQSTCTTTKDGNEPQ